MEHPKMSGDEWLEKQRALVIEAARIIASLEEASLGLKELRPAARELTSKGDSPSARGAVPTALRLESSLRELLRKAERGILEPLKRARYAETYFSNPAH